MININAQIIFFALQKLNAFESVRNDMKQNITGVIDYLDILFYDDCL